MESIEVSAKSLEEAVGLAAERLGVSPAQVSATVLEETKGLFGKGGVRIEATISEARQSIVEVKEPEAKKPAAKPERKRASKAKPETVVEAVSTEEVEAEPASDVEEHAAASTVVATSDDAREMAELVNEILRLSGLEASAVERGTQGRYVNLELDGKDVAYLIGKRGEVLNSFQYILNTIAGTRERGGVRVVLDGENYRTRREAVLKNLALGIASQVRVRGEEAVLDALPAFERRVVHQALQDYEGVATYSEGEEPNRRVVIAPAG